MTYPKEITDIVDTESCFSISVSKKYKNVKAKIIELTNFLDDNVKFSVRIFYIKNNITSHIICPVCNINKSKPQGIGNNIAACSVKCANNRIDELTGLTKKQQIALTIKKQRGTVNPKTGLTRGQEIAKTFKENNNKIDKETGLTRGELTQIKRKKTYLEVDLETGLTRRELCNKNLSKALNTVQDSGFTLSQEMAQKTKETLSKIDSETGLSFYYTNIKKSTNTMMKKDENGLSIFDKTGLKNKKRVKLKTYQNRINDFPIGYTLLTTETEYINASNSILNYSCNKCGTIRDSYYKYIRCTTCYPYIKSMAEHEVLEYCQSLSDNILSNSRSIIKPLELDVYLPHNNLAIEYNGLFWHSSYSTDSENKSRHLNKTKLCQEKGIQLFHIFENEWINPIKQAIWKSIIKNRLGQSSRIYARKTKVAQINSKDKKQFLIDNHLQGDCSSSVNLGLYLDTELVSVMTFGKSRYNKKIDWELLRFCNKLGTRVVGGAGKLLKSFRRENVGSIVSYADKRRSIGGLYKQLGFELSHDSKPNYWYYKDAMELESRIKYQKHKLKDILDAFNPDKTESENMYENGYRKIYDCGNQIWILPTLNLLTMIHK